MALKPHTSKFLAEVVEKIADPAKQAAAKALFEDGTLETAFEYIGDGVLRHSDYSRSMNELKTKSDENDQFRAQLDDWHKGKQGDLAELAERRRLNPLVTPAVPAPVVPGVPPPAAPAAPAVPNPDVVSRKEFETTLDQTERGAVAFFNELNRLSLSHFQAFGEILDTTAITNDKRLDKLGLDGVYKAVHAEKLAAKSEATRKAAEDAVRADERKKVEAEFAATRIHHPAFAPRATEPSALDTVEAARVPGSTAPVHTTIDQMAANYAALQAGRT